MYADILNDKTDFDNLKDIYKKIREIFSNVKSHEDISIEELVELYSHDDVILNDLFYIKDSLSEIYSKLAPIDELNKERISFFSIKLMIDYLIEDTELFIKNLSFIEDLLVNFFNLIHFRLSNCTDYQKIYNEFFYYLEKQKEFFYTEVYSYSGEFEDTIIEINNILCG